MSLWTPPAANQGWWAPGTNIGIPGGLWQYLAGGVNDRAVTGTVVDMVATYGLDTTGSASVDAAVMTAIAAASGPTVLDFDTAGTYLFDTGFIYSNYKDNITIRGRGSDTLFRCSKAGFPIFIFSSPGLFTDSQQLVTGTKTKGTSVLTVASSAAYSAGRLALVIFENETDDARIIAGASPVIAVNAAPFIRQQMVMVTATGSGTITIDPPLTCDATNLTTYIQLCASSNTTQGWGFEDFDVSFDAANHPRAFVEMNMGAYNWVHNVNFLDWSKTTSNGSAILSFQQYRNEIRKCKFLTTNDVGVSSDGAVQTQNNTSCFNEDNIVKGQWGAAWYDSGNTVNCAYTYNYAPEWWVYLTHDPHQSLNVVVGNVFNQIQEDPYFGSSSHNNFYRNYGGVIAIGRFKTNMCIAGNSIGAFSWGNPNLGNGDAHGFAGPTGLSTRAGTLDYLQDGVGPFTYEIQPSDIFVGDFWDDWKTTAELITRTSDDIGVFQVSGGNWYVGNVPTGGAPLVVSMWWSSYSGVKFSGSVTSVAGDMVTVQWSGGTPLPTVGTIMTVGMGPAGYQERWLDAEATSTVIGNAVLGVIDNPLPGGTTFPKCLVWGESTPPWWNDDGFAGAFPPIDPDDEETWSPLSIPAGDRYFSGAPPEAPVFVSNPIATGPAYVGNLVTVAGGIATGNPAPSYAYQVQLDGVDVGGETGTSYTPLIGDLGKALRWKKTASNGESPDDVAYSNELTITLFMGDVITLTQTPNSDPVSDLVKRGPVAKIATSSVANPTVITTEIPHNLETGRVVRIIGHTGSTPSINGNHTITKTGASTFTIPVNVTVGGTGGLMQATPTEELIEHSGDYPQQLDNNFNYQLHGTGNKLTFTFAGHGHDVGDAIASRP